MTTRLPPRFVPILTEVVQGLPDEAAATLSPHRVPGGEGAAPLNQEALVQQVLVQLQSQLEPLVRACVREALASSPVATSPPPPAA